MAIGEAENDFGQEAHMRINQDAVILCLVAIMWPGLAEMPLRSEGEGLYSGMFMAIEPHSNQEIRCPPPCGNILRGVKG